MKDSKDMSEVEKIQHWLQEKIAGLLFVEPELIDIHEPFVNYGLGSADAVGMSGEMEEWLGQKLSPTLFYDRPCIADVADYLVYGATRATELRTWQAQIEPIALIGMGCRFPGGANTPERFWELLRAGFDAIIEVPANRWDLAEFYSPDADAPGKMYLRTGGFLPELDQFDATFFGISPQEAIQMHPQQRMLLEVAWEALENAGQKASDLAGSNTGVFVGLMDTQDYAQLQTRSGDSSYVDNPYFGLGSAANIAAGRLSYFFDFQGPNLTIDTACSSSLAAAHLACQSLRQQECNLALVGGVSTYLLPEHVVNGCKIRMLGQSGRCRTFDAQADGSTIGEGCGVVVLKRLSDARAQGDTILAIIRGSAVNQDGRSNGITAPSKQAQEAVIRQALTNAGLEPQRVSYVEAHGTGTQLGDSIEVAALATTIGTARSTHMPEHPLVIGSVKTNIGHLAGAAGIAGLIKTVLSLSHQEIPPHLNLQERNPLIRWDTSPITIPAHCMAWPEEETTRIAGVSSFGWSGTNAHLLLEEGLSPVETDHSQHAAELLLISAKTEAALELATDNLVAYLKHHPEVNLADVAYTTQVARAAFLYRRIVIAEDLQSAIAALEQRDPSSVLTMAAKAPRTERVLLETGIEQELHAFIKRHSLCDSEELLSDVSTLPAPSEPLPPSQALLIALGNLWLAGISLNWRNLYSSERRALISLPTYPFEHHSYWIDQHKPVRPLATSHVSQESTFEQVKRENFDDWFSLPGWKSSNPRTPDFSNVQTTTSWIFFLDACEIGAALVEELRQHQAIVHVVTPGKAFSQSGEQTYTIHPTEAEDYEALFQKIRVQGCQDMRIVHLWTVTDPEHTAELRGLPDFESATQTGFSSVLTMVQALESLPFDTCQITLVSNGIQDVSGNEMIFPEKATLLGPCLVIPFEYPDITCRSIDITLPEAGSWQRDALLSQLLGELTSTSDEPSVALRNDRRWLPEMERLQFAEPSTPTAVLREEGVYLITGGLGGIGLAVAEYLARQVRARLVLVGRSALPPREEWPQLRASLAKEDQPGRQLQAIQRIEALGGQVLPIQADVTNQVQMQEVIRQTFATFGTLHGVFHAAGVPGMGLIQLKTPEQAASVLAPKVLGTLVLAQVLDAIPLDFLVLFSSITSFTGGGPGQMDYAAANAFLDAYAHRYHRRHGKTLAIDWGEWQWNAWEEGLSGYSSDVQQSLREHRQYYGISLDEGTQALGYLLASRQPRVIVSTQDLQKFTSLLRRSFTTGLRYQEQPGEQARPRYPRPALASSYTPPRNELEQTIVAIWEELLGVEPIGIYDNFFELGGNSLVGINLLTRIRKTLHIENFPAHVLYEAPSISSLAHYIGQGQDSGTIKERQERGEKRRAGSTRRLETARRRK